MGDFIKNLATRGPLAMPMTSGLSIRFLSLFEKQCGSQVAKSYSKPHFQWHCLKALIGE